MTTKLHVVLEEDQRALASKHVCGPFLSTQSRKKLKQTIILLLVKASFHRKYEYEYTAQFRRGSYVTIWHMYAVWPSMGAFNHVDRSKCTFTCVKLDAQGRIMRK